MVSPIYGVFYTRERENIHFFPKVHHSYTRIDYFFVDKRLIPHVRSCELKHSIVISDHAPLASGLYLLGVGQARRQWRMNSSLLSDMAFVTWLSGHITLLFLETIMTPDVSYLTIWDTLNAYLRGWSNHILCSQ